MLRHQAAERLERSICPGTHERAGVRRTSRCESKVEGYGLQWNARGGASRSSDTGSPEAVGGWFRPPFRVPSGTCGTSRVRWLMMSGTWQKAGGGAAGTQGARCGPWTIEAAGIANFYQNNVAVVPQVWRHWKEAVQPCEGRRSPCGGVWILLGSCCDPPSHPRPKTTLARC